MIFTVFDVNINSIKVMKGFSKISNGVLVICIMAANMTAFAQTDTNPGILKIKGEAAIAPGQIIADRDANYDVNGNLAAGLWILSDFELLFESSLGLIKQLKVDDGYMLFLSPDERLVTMEKKGLKSLDLNLIEAGIKLESGKVWQVEVEERRLGDGKENLEVIEELAFMANEIIADRDANKTSTEELTAGIKVYSNWEGLSFDSDGEIVKVQEAKDYWLLYISPGATSISIMMDGKEPLAVNLSEIDLQGGSVYSLRVE